MANEKSEQAKQAPATLDAHLPKKLADLMASVTEKDLRGPNKEAETLKGTTTTPGVWVYSPATFKFSALASRRLTKCARWSGKTDTQVTRVHARFVGETNTVLIKPADPLDVTAFEVAYYSSASGGVVNLYDLLGPANSTVETGYRQRYDVHLVPKGSPLWPGLVINLGESQERKVDVKKKKGEGSAED